MLKIVCTGISAFVKDDKTNTYTAHSYNFHLFPSVCGAFDRRFSMQVPTIGNSINQCFVCKPMILLHCSTSLQLPWPHGWNFWREFLGVHIKYFQMDSKALEIRMVSKINNFLLYGMMLCFTTCLFAIEQ